MDALPLARERRISPETWAAWLAWLLGPGSLVLFERLSAGGHPLCWDATIPTAAVFVLATHIASGAVTFGLLTEFIALTIWHSRRHWRCWPPEFWLLLGYWGAWFACYFAYPALPFWCPLALAWVGLATTLLRAIWLLWAWSSAARPARPTARG